MDHSDLGGGPPRSPNAEDVPVSPGNRPSPAGGPRPRRGRGGACLGAGLRAKHPSTITGLAAPAETFRHPVCARLPAPYSAYRHCRSYEPKVGHGWGHRVAQELPSLGAALRQGEPPGETLGNSELLRAKEPGSVGGVREKPVPALAGGRKGLGRPSIRPENCREDRIPTKHPRVAFPRPRAPEVLARKYLLAWSAVRYKGLP